MPKTQFAELLHAEKHRSPGESFEAAMHRNAFALKDNDEHYNQIFDIFSDQRFLAGGRVQTAIGSEKAVTAYNCFVSGTIQDNFVGSGGIMDRAREAATTLRMGGGVGYDFSTLRPRGDEVKSIRGKSTGPVSFMEIFNAVGNATSSTGERRGAQMAVLRIDHPDIEEFIKAKNNSDRFTRFNISVGVTDEFMEAKELGRPFSLRWGGKTYRTINARELWAMIMESTWEWAEPGVLFIDRINSMNNLNYCETIRATNPCGEQPLPPNGACLLGSFNLTKYVYKELDGKFSFNWNLFRSDIPPVVRAMDNVINRTIYPLPVQKIQAIFKRRMGLGVTGLANTLEALGMPYGCPEFLSAEAVLLSELAEHAYRASSDLAVEKGPFKSFNAAKYLNSPFIKSLSNKTQQMIEKQGIRNSHLTSIAPTGTISMLADNVSSSIEPVFAHTVKRTVNLPGGPMEVYIDDYGYANLGVKGKTYDQVTLEEHVNVLTTAQRFVDSAVSKTINVPANADRKTFEDVYTKVWASGGKGCTTYREGCKRGAVIEAVEEASCQIDPSSGRRNCE